MSQSNKFQKKKKKKTGNYEIMKVSTVLPRFETEQLFFRLNLHHTMQYHHKKICSAKKALLTLRTKTNKSEEKATVFYSSRLTIRVVGR